jgi:hypothetical protein
MPKIDVFIKSVSSSRKRTAIVFMEDEMKTTINKFKALNIQVIDASDWAIEKIIFSENELVDMILENSIGKTTLIINLELFLAPRFEDNIFFKGFIQKLMVREPLHPIFILFYSQKLYEKFREFYKHHKPTENHYLDNSERGL